MSKKTIQLMSFIPKVDSQLKVYCVDLPTDLRDCLFGLLPTQNSYGNLMTSQLKQDLRCWLDGTVGMSAIKQDSDGREWIVALQPVDLERLCNVIANYLYCTCNKGVRSTDLYQRTMRMLEPQTFEAFVSERVFSPFDDMGRPTDSLSFMAFTMHVASSIVGREIQLPNGVVLTFNQVSNGGPKGCELVSNVLWHDDEPWAVVLKFHLETIPKNREARLNLDIGVRRYITSSWVEDINKLNLKKNVNAYVRAGNGILRVIPYGSQKRGNARSIDWNEFAKRNYESMGLTKLPSLHEYLHDMTSFAKEDHEPQILSPYAAIATWANRSRVENGMPIPDKAMIFETVASFLTDLADVTEPLVQQNSAAIHLAHKDATSHGWRNDPVLAQSKHLEYTCSNRRRLATCLKSPVLTIEILGTSADSDVVEVVRSEIAYVLGEEETNNGMTVHVEEMRCDNQLAELNGTGDQAMRSKWEAVEHQLGSINDHRACIVLLPGADRFASGRDPKQAIRIGLARTGRLSQFLIPYNEGRKDDLNTRARAAVRDLMRQLGFTPELRKSKGGAKIDMPAWGITVCTSPQGTKKMELPIAVKLEPQSGLVTVSCPLFKGERLSYKDALLRLAHITSSKGASNAISRIDGKALKNMVDEIKAEASSDTLLLVHAYGCIRWPNWWPGLSDANLADGLLTYGPTRVGGSPMSDEPFERGTSKLSVVRVRNGGNSEVADYYTDEKSDLVEGSGLHAHYSRQGIFPAEGVVLGLASKPNDPGYITSMKDSKFIHPNHRFAEKTLNEYYLMTPGDIGDAITYARYAEALRGLMIQMVNSDMKVNLPAPLHLAELMREYIWCPTAKQSARWRR